MKNLFVVAITAGLFSQLSFANPTYNEAIGKNGDIVLIQSTQQCNNIRDNDRKAFCRAQISRRQTDCNHIRDRDTKFMCYAFLSGRKTDCQHIQDRDTKAYCLAQL